MPCTVGWDYWLVESNCLGAQRYTVDRFAEIWSEWVLCGKRIKDFLIIRRHSVWEIDGSVLKLRDRLTESAVIISLPQYFLG